MCWNERETKKKHTNLKIVEIFRGTKQAQVPQNAFNKLGFSDGLNDLLKMSLLSEIRLLKKKINDEDEN